MDLIEHLGYDPNRLLPAPRFIYAGPGRVTFLPIYAASPQAKGHQLSATGRFITDSMDPADLHRMIFGVDPTPEIEKFAHLRQAVDKWQKAIYAAWLAETGLGVVIDVESSGGDIPGICEMPMQEPTIPAEPRKQNGRSAAYLALDPTKNTRRGRTGRKFRTADNRSSRR